ncbi:hypothetical protein PR048_013527 [Dryococelus australis]|uniref:Uncharacterized protein n=1 Tax=Dryococelus australis TaxID=614101 RepID=A0ABQ9HSF5_9NEOP|nr:hypothetical protein PR048_013527 [Dryococelus australis]
MSMLLVFSVKIEKLSQGRKQALQSKVQKVASTFKDKLSSSFDINLEDYTEDMEESYQNEYLSTTVIVLCKNLCRIWGYQYLVRNTRQLVIKYGILPNTEQKKYKKLAAETKQTQDVPRHEGFFSVRYQDGEKNHIQKKLILCNI